MSVHALQPAGRLADSFGRQKRKLRLSLTDRCNFRCQYCMPEHPQWLPRAELLSFEELRRLARLHVAQLGISHIRLTGGEPLLRRDVVACVAALNGLRADGLQRLSMTSNGVLLPRLVEALVAAGLDDINISLDAVDAARFRQLTRAELAPVIAGIDAAIAAGLPVKLNAVVIRDHNEDQLLQLAEWAFARGLPLRLIEFMPLDGDQRWSDERVVPAREMLGRLGERYAIEALAEDGSPARRYRLDGQHELGIIATVTEPFCGSCDRLRITATGELFNCLFAETGTDLRQPLRAGANDDELLSLIRDNVGQKKLGYIARPGYADRDISMHALGG